MGGVYGRYVQEYWGSLVILAALLTSLLHHRLEKEVIFKILTCASNTIDRLFSSQSTSSFQSLWLEVIS